MNKEKVKQIIASWINNINRKEVIPETIIAINFNLYEPYAIDLIGSKIYDENDSDWACNEDFVPSNRDCPALNISENVDWEEFLELIVNILKELMNELHDNQIFKVEHIMVGFCDGDLYTIK